MFTIHGARQFWSKLKCLAIFSDHSLVNVRTSVKTLHSLSQSKGKGSSEQIGRQLNKFPKKAVKNEALKPKLSTRNIITNISNLLRYSTWDSAQEQLSMLSIRWDSYTVNQVLKTHPPLEKAWLFFNWASRLKDFKHDQFTYTTMLDIFGEARRISLMISVFQEMQEKGIKIDVVTYTSLMHWLSNDGDIDGSMKLWDEMKALGFRPTVVSYTAYMKILFAHKRVKEATEVYKEMLQSGCSPNCYTYTVLMDHLASSGKFDDVMEIFGKMQEAGVHPDKATCNILVEKCCKAGETKTINKILQYMKENFLVLRYPVYLGALETLEVSGESDFLLRQVNRHCSIEHTKLHRDELDAAVTDINSVIDVGIMLIFIHRYNFYAVDYLLASMMDLSIKLESGVLSAIIEVNSAHWRLKGALRAFEYSEKMGINIGREAYFGLIGLFIRVNSFPQVLEIFEKMDRDGIFLGTYSTALLIYKLGCARKPATAAKIFDLLPDDHKSTTAYTALISAYFSSGKAVRALKTFKTMQKQGISAALGTYNLLITGLEKCGRVHEIQCYRKEKKKLKADKHAEDDVPMEVQICDLLFAGD